MEVSGVKPSGLQCLQIVVIVLVLLQFTLGMAINLFVVFPSNMTISIPASPVGLSSPSASSAPVQEEVPIDVAGNWAFAKSQSSIVFHILNGGIIFVLVIVLLVRAIMTRARVFIVTSSCALVALTGAISGGASYISTQNQQFAYQMGSFFVVTLSILFGTFIWQGFLGDFAARMKKRTKA